MFSCASFSVANIWSPCWTGGRFGTSYNAKGRKTEKFVNQSADPRGLFTLNILRGLSAGKPIESGGYCLITKIFQVTDKALM